MGFTACPVLSAALCTAAKGLCGSSFLHRRTLLQSKGTALSIFVLCNRSHKGISSFWNEPDESIKHWNSATISQAPDSQMLDGCFHWLEELIVFSHHLSFLSGSCSASFSDHCIFTFYVKRQIKMKNVCFLKMSNEAWRDVSAVESIKYSCRGCKVQLTPSCRSRSRTSSSLSWPPRVPITHAHNFTQIHNFKN